MGLIALIEKLIIEHGSSASTSKHLALLKEQAQIVENKLIETQKENSELKTKLAELDKEITHWLTKDKFEETRGGLFKRKSEGGYHICVYCPDCFGPIVSVANQLPFACSHCKRSISFTGNELEMIMKELPQ